MPKKAKTSTSTKKKIIKRKKTKGEPEENLTRPKKKVTHRDYIFAVGRRKTAIARVRFYNKKENIITVNNQNVSQYFPEDKLQKIVSAPIILTNTLGSFSIRVLGGGKKSQAESIRLGISRVIVKKNPDFKKQLRIAGFLTRDARSKERKKPGLKRARRAPQWQKR